MPAGRVLVVDDDEDVRKTVRLTLTKADYDVVEAADGETGVEAIRSGDNPVKVDVILCDIHMPKINGIEAIAYFRQQFPSVPVVVITGQPEVSGAAHLFKQGVVEYLVKPVAPEKLTEVVNKYAKEHVFKDDFRV